MIIYVLATLEDHIEDVEVEEKPVHIPLAGQKVDNPLFSVANRRERSGSVVECLTRDRRAAGSSLTGVTALWSLSKTHLS